MLALKRVLVGFVAFVAVLLGIGLLLPREVRVERSTTIDAPVGVVFPLVNDLRAWERWTPWGKDRDSSIELTYGDRPSGKGAWFAWTSEDLGAGKLEIVDSRPNQSIDMLLSLTDDASEPADCGFTFDAVGGKTKVTWHFDADMGVWPPGRYFGLFMDRLLGRDYENGLAKLKTVAERDAKEKPMARIEAAFRERGWRLGELSKHELEKLRATLQDQRPAAQK
jgi:hypothetical protein